MPDNTFLMGLHHLECFFFKAQIGSCCVWQLTWPWFAACGWRAASSQWSHKHKCGSSWQEERELSASMTLVSLVWVKVEYRWQDDDMWGVAAPPKHSMNSDFFFLKEMRKPMQPYMRSNINISGHFYYREFIFLAMNPGNLPKSALIWLKSLLPLCYGGFVDVLRDSCPCPALKDHDGGGGGGGARRLLSSVLMLAGKVSQPSAGGQISGMKLSPKRQQFYFHSPHRTQHWHLGSYTRVNLGDLDEGVNLSGRPRSLRSVSHTVAQVFLPALQTHVKLFISTWSV